MCLIHLLPSLSGGLLVHARGGVCAAVESLESCNERTSTDVHRGGISVEIVGGDEVLQMGYHDIWDRLVLKGVHGHRGRESNRPVAA